VRDPEVTVFVRQFGGYQVYVLGEVNNPGGFPLQREMNVFQPVAVRVVKELGLDQAAAKKNFSKTDSALHVAEAAKNFRKNLIVGSAKNSNVMVCQFQAEERSAHHPDRRFHPQNFFG